MVSTAANIEEKFCFYSVRSPIFALKLGNRVMKESVRILRFAIVGTSNALIAAIVIWLLMDVLDCNYLWSNVAGYVASLVNNFVCSKYWVFSARQGKFMQ